MKTRKMTKTTLILAAALGAMASGCSVSDGSEGSKAPASADESTAEGAEASSSPEYAVSCQGDVSKLSTGLGSVASRCVGGEVGTFGCDDPCAAQAINVRYEPPAMRCGVSDVYAWDGAACKAYPTQTSEGAMRCSGSGCEKLFKTEDDCKAAFQECVTP